MFKQFAQAAVVASVALTGLAATPAFAHDRYERGDYYNDGYRGTVMTAMKATAGHAIAAIMTTATTTTTAMPILTAVAVTTIADVDRAQPARSSVRSRAGCLDGKSDAAVATIAGAPPD
jgi:hypothetical protein